MTEIYRTALSGLAAAGARLASDANNIANLYSTGRLPDTPGGATDAYAPTRVTTQSAPQGGVTIDRTTVTPSYVVAADPASPKANADGLVATPNADLATELVDMTVTSVLYAADAAVIKTAAENDRRLLDILA